MEASIFEKMSDRVIFTIAKEVITEFDIEYAENAGDYMFYEAVVDACKMYSIDPSIQDTDFLYNIIKLNKPMFEEGSLTSKLERPTLKNYEYEWSVTFKKIVNEYYFLIEHSNTPTTSSPRYTSIAPFSLLKV